FRDDMDVKLVANLKIRIAIGDGELDFLVEGDTDRRIADFLAGRVLDAKGSGTGRLLDALDSVGAVLDLGRRSRLGKRKLALAGIAGVGLIRNAKSLLKREERQQRAGRDVLLRADGYVFAGPLAASLAQDEFARMTGFGKDGSHFSFSVSGLLVYAAHAGGAVLVGSAVRAVDRGDGVLPHRFGLFRAGRRGLARLDRDKAAGRVGRALDGRSRRRSRSGRRGGR